jgi:predicted YcjX-like family ATPase
MFNALYTSMLYRRKKVKSFKEGFIERSDRKLVLMDENKKVVE